MIRVTERFSDRRMSYAEPYVATRVFDVSGTKSEETALTATDESGKTTPALAVPQQNETHDQNSAMFCLGPKVRERPGPEYWTIECDYRFDPSPGLVGQINPLNLPTQYIWSPLTLSDQTDTDADGKIICNAVGDVATQGQTYRMKTLRAVKNFTTIDASWFALEGTCNQATVNIHGLSIAAEHMALEDVTPAPYYKNAASYYTVEFTFTVCIRAKLGASRFPLHWRVLNETDQLWYRKTGGGTDKARISDATGNLLDHKIRIDNAGLPLSNFSATKVGKDHKDAVGVGNTYPCFDQDVQSDAVWRYYRKYKPANLSALPIW